MSIGADFFVEPELTTIYSLAVTKVVEKSASDTEPLARLITISLKSASKREPSSLVTYSHENCS